MAPSPAAGKAQGAAGSTPRTPTKLGRKPQSSQTPKLGSASGAKPAAPKLNKPEAPAASEATEKATEATDSAKDTADEATEDVPEPSKVELKDDEDDDEDDGPLSKVSEAKEGLEEQAPQPVEDDDDEDEGVEDAVGGAQETAEDAAEGAEEEVEDVEDVDDDDVTEKAGDNDDDTTAEDTADEATDDAQETGQKVAGDAQETAGGALDSAKGLAGKASGLVGKAAEDPSKAAGDAAETVQETAEDAKDAAADAVGDAEKVAGDAGDEAGEVADEATDKAGDVADEATDKAGDVADEATDKAGEVTDEATAKAGEVTDEATDAAGEATDKAAEKVPEVEEVGEQAEDAADEATDGAEPSGDLPDISSLPIDLEVLNGLEVSEDGVVYDNEGKAIGKLAEGDAEDLAGYQIGENGEILDEDGDLVGRVELLPDEIRKQMGALKDEGKLPEGAEDIVGQLPEPDIPDDEDELQLPGPDVLNGLTCGVDGLIYNADGDYIGRVIDGDPQELMNATLNESGEFVDADGNVIGHAEVAEEAAELYDTAEAAGDEAGEAAEGAEEGAEGALDEAAPEGIEDELPGIEALQGKELNEAGEIVDDSGNVLGNLEEGSLKDKLESGDLKADELEVNEEGQVIDSEGNVVGQVGLAEGAAEKLRDAVTLDLRILDGKKLNKKGKILDDEGEPIGELTEGELKDCAGKKVNDKGEVLDKSGKVIGRVQIVPGEAAETATKELLEELGESPEEDEEAAEEEAQDDGPQFKIPGLETLEGLKINKKGKILNEEGEIVGELSEGELASCAGKKVNEKGEILDDEGAIIGRAKITPLQLTEEEIAEGIVGVSEEEAQAAADAAGDAKEGAEEAQEGAEDAEEGAEGAEEGAEGAEEGAEGAEEGAEGAEDGAADAAAEAQEAAEDAQDAAEDSANQLPPLSVLEGLKVNKAGKLIDSKGVIVGELVEGDAKKLAKAGITADAEGQFWDTKGHVIGRAETVAVEDPDEEAPFAGLEGLTVVQDGYVEDENDNRVGIVVEGDAKKLVGRAVDEDGDIIDKKGSVVGHAERWEEPEEEAVPEEEVVDLSFLEGKPVNKAGLVISDEGIPVARLVEGNVKEIGGRRLDKEGQIWNDSGRVIGRVELIPDSEREAKPEGPFAGLEGLRVVADGQVADEDENIVGKIVEGNPKRLIGLRVDEDGDIIDKFGNVKGHAEPLEEEEEVVIDNSVLEGKMLNKQGFVVSEDGIPIGKLVEGNVKELAGRRCDENGYIHGDTGKIVGRCEVLPENERVAKPEGPFAGLEGLHVNKDGYVEDQDANVVGIIVEGNAKRLVGNKVDEDGDIIDKYGNVKGHADPWEEEEQTPEDLQALAGCTVNKAGNVVNDKGTIMGRVVEGDPATMIGKKVDGQGQIWDNAGNVIGRAELAKGTDTSVEGPFAGFDDVTVNKEGYVVTPDGTIVGRLIEGDIKKVVGHKVDEEGEIQDKNGNIIGKAERYDPEDKERRNSPMSGRRVNKEGEVRDEEGNIMGRLTAGDLGHCAGCEIDDNGNVVDNDGNKIGECTLLENIVEDEELPELTDEERAELEKREEERQIAEKMANICTQTLERIQPVCKQITEHMEAADRKPKEELDEEQLVNDVKPLIEEGGRILQECNGSLRGLDPDGHIAAQAKGRSGTKDASPEEHRLAETLKELTTTVVTTIDNAKKKLNDMPHAKKKLNPLWGILTQPLFQILAAVGLLLAGVLGLVGQLLNGLGLGGLVNGIFGGLGIDKLMSGLGLGDLFGGGKDAKKKGGSALSKVPIIGGMLGSSK